MELVHLLICQLSSCTKTFAESASKFKRKNALSKERGISHS